MDFLTLLLLAAGLSMDAFAVSVCKGMSMKKTGLPQALVVGLWFGVFQALMPIIGYFLGIQFMGMISAFRTMLMAAVATSIDALAVGVSFAVMNDVNIWISAGTIGVVTLTFSVIGVKAGHLVGRRLASKAEIIGGIILICIGIKILIEHTVLGQC